MAEQERILREIKERNEESRRAEAASLQLIRQLTSQVGQEARCRAEAASLQLIKQLTSHNQVGQVFIAILSASKLRLILTVGMSVLWKRQSVLRSRTHFFYKNAAKRLWYGKNKVLILKPCN